MHHALIFVENFGCTLECDNEAKEGSDNLLF